MSPNTKIVFSIYLALMLLAPVNLLAKTKAQYNSELLRVKVSSTAPQSISAFYEARGFQKEMINILKQQCFVTIFIKNKSDNFIWLDLSKWKISNSDGEITRLDRHYWKQKWQQMNIPLAQQSTFRWTLLPEQLDFHPNEHEGGNIILPRTGKAFTISASFPTQADKQGQTITINFTNIECATDQ